MKRVLEFSATVTTASIGVIRNLLSAEVARAGIVLDESRAYALRVCSSEFVDNAIKHAVGQGPGGEAELLIEVGSDRERSRLRITVTDPSVVEPLMNSTIDDLDATCGRGLVVADGYADDIGWHQRLDLQGRPTGWSVRFELDVEPETFGQATAAGAEVQPEAVTQPSERRVKVVSGHVLGNAPRPNRPTQRPGERTALAPAASQCSQGPGRPVSPVHPTTPYPRTAP
ncbi:ATP-binding protein [Kitasatospora sp. NPDC127067]|uniref:ATP-binding protein n=1 Tax=Kitasatospora sp. NPDC127067 TaxID=3347126 RepID=UPI00365F330E